MKMKPLHTRSSAAGTFSALLVCFSAAPLRAQDQPATPPEPDASPYRIQARASLWIPSLDGELQLGGAGNTEADLSSFFDVDDNEASLNADLIVQRDRWMFWADAYDFQTSADTTSSAPLTFNGLTAPAGSTLDTEFGVTSVGGRLGYDLLGDLAGKPDDAASMHIHGLLGLRGVNLDHSLSVSGVGNSRYDQWHAVGEAGVRLSILADPDWSDGSLWDVSTAAVIGLGADLTTLDVWLAISYQIDENVGLTFGYRQMDYNVEDGGFDYDGRLAGIFFGGQVRF